MLTTPTPHISARPGDFGKTVLMPGDPLRAKFIAENFLENPVLVNNVRGVQGHTGTYKGVKVSVMASGMGMPAIGIYSHELFNGYGVENIIRVGSAGSIQENINLYDLVIAQGACTDSNWAKQFHLPGTFAPIASWVLLTEAVKAACLEAVAATPKVLSDPAPDVSLTTYGSSSIEYTVRCWTAVDDYWGAFHALNENLRSAFERNGVEMTYDHLNVHVVEK